MSVARTSRLLELLNLLQSGRSHNASSLAIECRVSRRTIFRDLDLLRKAGVSLAFDELEQRFTMTGERLLPPTNFSTDEALAILVLCHELGGRSGVPFYAPAQSAAMKLASNLPARLRDQLRDLTEAVEIQLPPRNPLEGREPVYERLIAAIGRLRSVRLYYDSLAEGGEVVTRLNPYRVFFSRRSWYVIGRSTVHRAVRTFNVSRIQKLEPLDDAYQIPPRFSLEKYLRNAWHLVPELGPDSDVLIRFQPLVARNVAEVQWHKTQQATFNADGTLDFRVTVSGLNEISWWVLGYGDQAEVIEPPALRAMLAERSQRMAAMYQNGKS